MRVLRGVARRGRVEFCDVAVDATHAIDGVSVLRAVRWMTSVVIAVVESGHRADMRAPKFSSLAPKAGARVKMSEEGATSHSMKVKVVFISRRAYLAVQRPAN